MRKGKQREQACLQSLLVIPKPFKGSVFYRVNAKLEKYKIPEYMFFSISKIRWTNQFHLMILLKGYCGWKQSSKEVPVSRLVNVFDLSSVLGFVDSTALHCLTWRKTSIFIREILSGYFLRTSRLKPYKLLCKRKKVSFERKNISHLGVCGKGLWIGQWIQNPSLRKCCSHWKENLAFSPGLRSPKN